MSTALNALHSVESDEWYTPRWICDNARLLCGRFDLDPASCAYANEKFVRADRYFSKKEGVDGLNLDWECNNLWLNPPYSDCGEWVSVAIMHWLTHAINSNLFILVNANFGTKWFQQPIDYGTIAVFFRERIKFIDQRGVEQSQPTHGNALFWFNRNEPNLALMEAREAFKHNCWVTNLRDW